MVAGPANGRTGAGASDLNEAMSFGEGYSLVTGSPAPSICDRSLVFWPRGDWDEPFRQLVASVCSSAASIGEPPIETAWRAWVWGRARALGRTSRSPCLWMTASGSGVGVDIFSGRWPGEAEWVDRGRGCMCGHVAQ